MSEDGLVAPFPRERRAGPRRRFSAEEDAYIVAHYSTLTLVEMARALSRSDSSICHRCDALVRAGKLDRSQRAYHRNWTEREDDWLSDHWGVMGDDAIAARLRRSVVAVAVRAKRLGLTRRLAVYSASDVARLFGVGSKAVVVWAERGWVEARRSPIRCGPNRVWSFSERSLDRFVRDCGWAYDWRRMEPGEYLSNLAKRVDSADPWLTIPEVSRLLGRSPCFIRRWISRGVLPFRRRPKQQHAGDPAGLIVVRKSDLDGFLASYPEIIHVNRSVAAQHRRRGGNERIHAA